MNNTVSDLFFNHEHPHLDDVLHVDNPMMLSKTDEEVAILADAVEFVKLYGSVIIDCPTAEELADDFLSRI